MANQQATGLRRLVNAVFYSWAGFRACFQNEEAFRQEMLLVIVMLPLGIWLGEGGVEKALLIGSLLLIPLVELLNSAVEAVVDRIGEEQHELAGRAKDMGSAAVLLSIILAAVVWALILLPRYI